jgi:eukaryotic-like serine/threonine-protein kinase
MSPEQYQKAKELFDSALEIAPERRRSFLLEHCSDDAALRSEVERLLDSYDSEYLEEPAIQKLGDLVADQGFQPGHLIGHYKVVSKLGSGGMGEVYLAEDGKLGRRVAIKALPEAFTQDHDRLNRFQQEARAASALNHPNILTIHEIGEAGITHYIATEYIDGETLRERMNRGKLPLSEALDIAVQCASALAAAHEEGIVHRDIKPENIMIRRDGLVKVLDFGLAKLLEKKQPAAISHDAPTERHLKTAPGMIMGTVRYMSPEQARGHSTDARTDIWSLGVVIYEMLAGEPPFKGDTSADLIAEIVKTHPLPISLFVPETSDSIDKLVAKTIEKNPDERYQTAKDVLNELQLQKRHLDRETELAHSTHRRITREDDQPADTGEDAKTVITVGDPPHTVHGSKETVSSAEYIVAGIVRHKRKAFGLGAFGLAVLASIGFGAYYFIQPNKADSAAQAIRVTTTGKARTSAISQDGKYIAYSLEELGKWSLWIKHVPTQQSTQIVSPSDAMFGKLSLSSDANYVYYTRSTPGESVYGTYVLPIIGGTPRKIADAASLDGFDLSRSGDRVAFIPPAVRRGSTQCCELRVVNTNGAGETTVQVRLDSIESFSWSRNDEAIAFVSSRHPSDRPSLEIVEVDLGDLWTKIIPVQNLYEIRDITWRPDGSGYLLIAKESEMSDLQVWSVTYPTGAVRRITNDFGDYNSLSLTGDPMKIVSVRSVTSSGIWVGEIGDLERAKQITFGSGIDGQMGISWAPNGQIIYTSYTGDRQDIWRMDSDGSNQRQLTLNSGNNIEPSVCADDRYIVFVSDRSGTFNIWRMDRDGSNPVQLTDMPGRFPQCSPDGNWVIYQSFWVKDSDQPPALWKIPLVGGNGELLADDSELPAISPNGKSVAFLNVNGIVAMPEAGGTLRKILKVASRFGVPRYRMEFYRREPHFRWHADSSGLVYVTDEGLWSIGLGESNAQKLSDFDGEKTYWNLSPDGLKMAFRKISGVASDVVLISDWQS